MKGHPEKYGSSLGAFVQIPTLEEILKFGDSGLDNSVAPDELEGNLTPSSYDWRFDGGGLTQDNAYNALITNGRAGKKIIDIAEFDQASGARKLVSLDETGMRDLTIGNVAGAWPAAPTNHIYYVVMDGLLVAANLNWTHLQSWNGVGNVQDLSADAPNAGYVVKLGNRLVAGGPVTGGSQTNNIYWSADGLITDWTTAALGAGSVLLEPEGRGDEHSYVSGLGMVEGAGVIYRPDGIVLMQPTGIGAAPFRFTTVNQSMGTRSPHSIQSGGPKPGNFYLGTDLNVYFFDGRSAPIPIGIPIKKFLELEVLGFGKTTKVTSAMDRARGEYWLLVPDSNNAIPNYDFAYIFNAKEWVKSGKISWRRKRLNDNIGTSTDVTAIGFGPDMSGTEVSPAKAIVLGLNVAAGTGGDPGVLTISTTSFVATADWNSKWFGPGQHEITVDRVRLWGYANTAASNVTLTLTNQDGVSVSKSVAVPLGTRPQPVTSEFRLIGRMFQLTVTAGSSANQAMITKLGYTYADRGRGRG